MPTLTITSGDSASFPRGPNNSLTNPILVTSIATNSGPVRVGENRGNGYLLWPGTPAVPNPAAGTLDNFTPGRNCQIRIAVPDLNTMMIFGAVGDGVTYQTFG